MPRRGFYGWADSQEAIRRRKLREERGHLWTCCRRRAPSEKQRAKGLASGGHCGREAVVIWCRVQGGGAAFLPACQAHRDLPGTLPGWSADDFQCVPVSEFDEFQRAKAVRSALVERAGAWPEQYLLPKAKR